MKDLDLPKTGKGGRPDETKMCFSYDLRYANVIKERGESYRRSSRRLYLEKISKSEISTSLLQARLSIQAEEQ